MAAPQNPYPPPYGGYNVFDSQAPFGRDPVTGQPLSDKDATVAGLLQLFLGMFGIGRFYIGSLAIGLIQMGLTLGSLLFVLITFGLGLIFAWPIWIGVAIWAFIDAILMFAGAVRDGRGLKLR
jgi:TM2 domain-containing membrane protein YozV